MGQIKKYCTWWAVVSFCCTIVHISTIYQTWIFFFWWKHLNLLADKENDVGLSHTWRTCWDKPSGTDELFRFIWMIQYSLWEGCCANSEQRISQVDKLMQKKCHSIIVISKLDLISHIAMHKASDSIQHMLLERLAQRKPSKLLLQRSCKLEETLKISTAGFFAWYILRAVPQQPVPLLEPRSFTWDNLGYLK